MSGIAPPAGRPTRETELWPYVEKLRAWSDLQMAIDEGGQEIETEIHVGGQTLIVQPWERRQVRRTFTAEEDELPAYVRQIAQGMALMTKCLSDLDRLRSADNDANPIFRIQADLMLDTVIGRSMAKEIDATVRVLRQVGEPGIADEMGAFRDKLLRAVTIASRGVVQAERDLAERRAQALEAEARDVEALSREIDAAAPGRHRDRPLLEEVSPAEEMRLAHEREREARLTALRQRRERMRAALPTRTGTLAIAFVISALLWSTLTLVPQLQQRDIPVVTGEDFSWGTAQTLSSIVARPPSLFATVTLSDWSRLSEQERLLLIEELGNRIAVLGYEGAYLSDGAGRPLGQWLRQRGARLTVRDGDPRPSAAPVRSAPNDGAAVPGERVGVDGNVSRGFGDGRADALGCSARRPRRSSIADPQEKISIPGFRCGKLRAVRYLLQWRLPDVHTV